VGLIIKKKIMSNINFEDGKWWVLSLGIAFPHQWFKLGWQIDEATKHDPTFRVIIFIFFISLSLEWGDENWEFEE
tara:strand:+ start:157 stop:381 length:225 start_codon:yes stop_codon:yes gene_type:complete